MALPSHSMGSYGLLMRGKEGLMEMIDAAIAVALSRWPDELQSRRGEILKLLGVDHPVKALAAVGVAAGKGKGKITAEIVVKDRKLGCDGGDVGGGGGVNINVKFRRPPMRNSSAKEAVAEARGKPRELSVEGEKRKIDGGMVLRLAGKQEERSRSRPCASPRKGETTADHYERRRRPEDEYHGDRRRDFDRGRYYGSRNNRNRDHDPRRYSGRSEHGDYVHHKRSFDHEERRYGGRRHEEEYYSAKRRRIDDEASSTNQRVIRYSIRFLLSMRPMD